METTEIKGLVDKTRELSPTELKYDSQDVTTDEVMIHFTGSTDVDEFEQALQAELGKAYDVSVVDAVADNVTVSIVKL